MEDSTAVTVEATRARRLWQNLQMRQVAFGHGFGVQTWDVLLASYVGQVDGKPATVGDLSRQFAVPQTTMIRRIDELEAAKLLERQSDPRDRRKTVLALSAAGLDRMRRYLRSLL